MTRILALLGMLASIQVAGAAQPTPHWPQFRGPNGDGVTTSADLPLTWSETNHITWKVPIHGRAWSSPVVWGDQIWITTATEDGRELYAICVSADTGKVVHDLKLFEVAEPQFAHKFNTYASPTPVIEQGKVYVTFGSPGTACLDTSTGKVLWKRTDFVCNHYRAAGSSPILFGDLLIMNFDGSDYQYVVALDKKTGETRWKTDRSVDHKDLDANGKPQAEGDFRKAFSTPHVAQWNGRPELISIGAKATYGYEPTTGRELWRVEERTSHSGATRPVIGKDLIYYPTGFSKGQLLAVRAGGQGDITDTHVVWREKRNVPCKPSLIFTGDLLFMVDDAGIASCLEPDSGKEVWRERVGGNYSASPLAAPGRIYFFNEEGKAIVVQASREFKVLGESKLEEGFMASPAVSGNALILRTKTHLYRIEG